MKVRDYSIEKGAFDFFFSLIGVFNHYKFFTEKLWKKVDGFENKDEAEVKCAFMSLWTEKTLGIYTYPVGMAWSTYCGNREIFNKYIKEWTPVFEAFQDWKSKQR